MPILGGFACSTPDIYGKGDVSRGQDLQSSARLFSTSHIKKLLILRVSQFWTTAKLGQIGCKITESLFGSCHGFSLFSGQDLAWPL